jgi:hypothetical protein
MGCKGCSTAKKIFTGYAYLMFGVNNDLSARRMKICRNCVKLVGPSCTICGCEMEAKTRLPAEICPDKKPKWLPEVA